MPAVNIKPVKMSRVFSMGRATPHYGFSIDGDERLLEGRFRIFRPNKNKNEKKNNRNKTNTRKRSNGTMRLTTAKASLQRDERHVRVFLSDRR